MSSDLAPAVVSAAAARRRYGRRALGLGVLALILVALALIAQSPPHLRRGGVALALILIALCVAMSALGRLWAWIIVWPTEKRRLAAAQSISEPAVFPQANGDAPGPLAVLVGGGILVGVLLWGFLNTVGLIGTPMLWIVVGTIELELARRVRRAERVEGATYYATRPALPFQQARRLFVYAPSATSQRPAAAPEQQATKGTRNGHGTSRTGGKKKQRAGSGRRRQATLSKPPR